MKYISTASVIVAVLSATCMSGPNRFTIAQTQKENQRILASVAVPKVRYATPAPDILKNGSAVLTITSTSMEEDVFYLGNDPLVQGNVARRVTGLLKTSPPDQQIVYLHIAKLVEYGAVASVLNSIREAELERVGLIVENEGNNRLATFDIKLAKKAAVPPPPMRQAKSKSSKAAPGTANRPPDLFLIDVVPSGAGLDQRVRLNGKQTELMELAPALRELLKQEPDKTVVIKAPADKSYADVVYVIDAVKEVGAQAVELQIDHLGDKRPRQKIAARDVGTSLIDAVKNDNVATVKSLLDRSLDLNALGLGGTLSLAAAWGHTEIVRLLLDKGVGDVNDALHRARKAEIARLLLAKGADVNGKNEAGLTALMNAGDLDLAQLLLANGADVSARDKDGATALMTIMRYGSGGVIQALLAKGADLNARNNSGQNALMYAAWLGEHDILRILLDKGADVNLKDNEGKTALIYAVEYIRPEAVGLLLAKRADVNVRDKAGKTALGYALEKSDIEPAKEVVEQLRKAGGKE